MSTKVKIKYDEIQDIVAEEITVQIIYYEKKKGGITIEFDF
jgi:hypothetical protein